MRVCVQINFSENVSSKFLCLRMQAADFSCKSEPNSFSRGRRVAPVDNCLPKVCLHNSSMLYSLNILQLYRSFI